MFLWDCFHLFLLLLSSLCAVAVIYLCGWCHLFGMDGGFCMFVWLLSSLCVVALLSLWLYSLCAAAVIYLWWLSYICVVVVILICSLTDCNFSTHYAEVTYWEGGLCALNSLEGSLSYCTSWVYGHDWAYTGQECIRPQTGCYCLLLVWLSLATLHIRCYHIKDDFDSGSLSKYLSTCDKQL